MAHAQEAEPMTKESNTPPPPGGQFLVYQTEDGKLKIDVRFEGETVWLTQQHMAELFQTTQQNISLHLQNIYAEGELQLEATYKESLSVRQEGARTVRRKVEFYNLDAILTHAGRISHEMAQAKAELEYDKFKALSASAARPVDADFEQATKDLRKLSKKPKPPKK
jgi:hypothetical protein